MANWPELFGFVYNNEPLNYIQPILNDTINDKVKLPVDRNNIYSVK
jgi:hypothetical protein